MVHLPFVPLVLLDFLRPPSWLPRLGSWLLENRVALALTMSVLPDSHNHSASHFFELYTCVCMCVYLGVYVDLCVCMYVYVYTCIYVYMFMYVHVYLYVYVCSLVDGSVSGRPQGFRPLLVSLTLLVFL